MASDSQKYNVMGQVVIRKPLVLVRDAMEFVNDDDNAKPKLEDGRSAVSISSTDRVGQSTPIVEPKILWPTKEHEVGLKN